MGERGVEKRVRPLERVTKKFGIEVRRESPNKAALVSIFDELYELATKDPLTGVLNRRSFEEALGREVSKAVRHKRNMCIIMIDIDKFKQYNDTYGHIQGDMALKKVTSVVKECTRDSDFVARYGGEEFIIVLPETNLNYAIEIAERMRMRINEARIPPSRKNLPKGYQKTTVSMGISELHAGHQKEEVSLALEKADSALYQAKESGRDKIIAAK